MDKRILITASLFGAVAVMLGAFGAHGLKNTLDSSSIEIWVKGVEYQFYHTFALLFLAQFKDTAPAQRKFINLAYGFFTFGILLFSGSLYLLATRSITNISFINFIGPITPIGGLLLIFGWLSVFFSALKSK